MEKRDKDKVSTFFSQTDIDFLKKINKNTENLESFLNSSFDADNKSKEESVTKEKYK